MTCPKDACTQKISFLMQKLTVLPSNVCEGFQMRYRPSVKFQNLLHWSSGTVEISPHAKNQLNTSKTEGDSAKQRNLSRGLNVPGPKCPFYRGKKDI